MSGSPMTTSSLAAVTLADHRAAEMTADEARALTDRIRSTATELWNLLLEAHERKAWAALGYGSWREYAKAEFAMSQSHVYRLLDAGRVVRALEAAAGSPVGEMVTERVARDIRPHLAQVTAEIRERVEHGEAPAAAIDLAVNGWRPDLRQRHTGYLTSRRRQDKTNRIIAQTVIAAKYVIEHDPELIDWYALDPDLVPEWVRELREAAREITKFANQLEKACRQ